MIKMKQDVVRGMKRQAFVRKTIFADYVSDKRFVSRLHRESSKLNNQKTKKERAKKM